jgi:hypothetical protein
MEMGLGWVLLIAAFVPLLTVEATAARSREIGPHIHGEGHLNIAYENGRFVIELDVPGDDVVGFEHAPADPQQQAAMDNAIRQLRAPLDLFRFPEAAHCSVLSADLNEPAQPEAEVRPPFDGKGHALPEGHLDFHLTYEISCGNVEAAEEIRFDYFKLFPRTEALQIQLVGEHGQSSGHVVRAIPVFTLKGRI